jgi:hypothetical protein
METRSGSNNDRTEMSRLKFVINQLKGNMQESEMRASAAENRVAVLQQQLKEMDGNKTKTQMVQVQEVQNEVRKVVEENADAKNKLKQQYE